MMFPLCCCTLRTLKITHVFRQSLYHNYRAIGTQLVIRSPTITMALRRSERLQSKWTLANFNRLYSGDNIKEVVVLIEHDPDTEMFFIDFGNLGMATVTYKLSKNHFTILETEVPPALEGRGLGKVLAKHVIKYIKDKGFSLSVECDFMQHYIDKYEPQMKYSVDKGEL